MPVACRHDSVGWITYLWYEDSVEACRLYTVSALRYLYHLTLSVIVKSFFVYRQCYPPLCSLIHSLHHTSFCYALFVP